ncbi:MAG: hypothetical protein QXT43_00460 [Candidatus Micrarchaeaceae archaeon]
MAKWNIRHGASLRKRYIAVASQKKGTYLCGICGKKAVKRLGSNIWRCKSCGATFAGGAFVPVTEAGRNAQRVLAVAKAAAQAGSQSSVNVAEQQRSQ